MPLLVKVAPDLADADLDAVADLALELGLDGIVATNTTISRDGLATPEVECARRRRHLRCSRARARRSRCCGGCASGSAIGSCSIGVGGIGTADDAWERIRAGATLVQAYTGMVYGGPLWAHRLHRDLAARVRADGLTSIEAAVGSAVASR